MAVTTFNARVKTKQGLMVECESRGFKVIIDEPVEAGGTNQGMNPLELLLCSLGSCQAITAVIFAEKFGVKLEDFWVEVEGDLDLDGFMCLADVRPGYSDIKFHFHIKSDSPEENIQKLVDLIMAKCPVTDSLANQVQIGNPKYTIER